MCCFHQHDCFTHFLSTYSTTFISQWVVKGYVKSSAKFFQTLKGSGFLRVWMQPSSFPDTNMMSIINLYCPISIDGRFNCLHIIFLWLLFEPCYNNYGCACTHTRMLDSRSMISGLIITTNFPCPLVSTATYTDIKVHAGVLTSQSIVGGSSLWLCTLGRLAIKV